MLLIAPAITGQSLTVAYRGDDGVDADDATFPVLATGQLAGTFTVETSAHELEYAAAYYSSNGFLLYSETDSADSNAWFVFRPQDRRLTSSDGQPTLFPISLPIGEQGGAQLPVGSFTLRVWAGPVGAMQYDPLTGVPISGFAGTATVPVTVQDVPYALYVPDPRNLIVNSQVHMRVLTTQPVTRDVVFVVNQNPTVGEVEATQVMIPRGETCSAEFTLQTAIGLAEGQIVLLDDNGNEVRSSMLRLVNESMYPLGENEDEPGIDDWAYCASKAKWRAYGENEQVCGGCSTNPTSPVECHVAPGASHGVYTKAVCGFSLVDDCELFRETHKGVQTYSASNTYNQSCGGTQWQVNANGQVTGGINGASGQVGGSISVSGQTVKYQKCCLVRHGPRKDLTLIQCRTID